MDPVESFTVETFRDRVGETFTVPDPGVELVLVDVTDHGQGAGARPGGAFSLFFRGPLETMLLQATHGMAHADLGEFALFLVPVTRTGDGFEYEAAFN